MNINIVQRALGYIKWTLLQWVGQDWLMAIAVVLSWLFLWAAALVLAEWTARVWITFREARRYYDNQVKPFPRQWPEQRVWGSNEL